MLSKTWKIAQLTLLSLFILLLALVGGGVIYRTYRHHEIAWATMIDPAVGVDEEFFARIGGIDQWLSIRGQSRSNPAILLLHQGAGQAQSSFPRDVFFSWTRYFTVVRWDQRGAGRTFSRSGPVASSITIDQMASDGVEVAELIRKRLHQPRIVLLGQSWGSMLGVRMAKARPDLFYAYVGTRQVVNQDKSQAAAYAQLLQEAHARGDHEAIAALSGLGPPPYDSDSKWAVYVKWVTAYEPGELSTWELISMALFDSEAGPLELRDYFRGMASSAEHFGEAIDRD